MYHTQEKRERRLEEPIKCVRPNAWLGDAYYFWDEEEDAHFWGKSAKQIAKSKCYEVYAAQIDTENVLDTVFNEKHYSFWVKQVEKTAKKIQIKTGLKPSIKEINQYFKDRADWLTDLDGVMFQDLPASERSTMVKNLFYKKRIQLAAYKLEIVNNFIFFCEENCN